MYIYRSYFIIIISVLVSIVRIHISKTQTSCMDNLITQQCKMGDNESIYCGSKKTLSSLETVCNTDRTSNNTFVRAINQCNYI